MGGYQLLNETRLKWTELGLSLLEEGPPLSVLSSRPLSQKQGSGSFLDPPRLWGWTA